MSSDAWHCFMQSVWARPRNAPGFEIFEPLALRSPLAAIRGIRSGFPQTAIAETSTSFQNALGSRSFTGKERPSFLVSRFNRAGLLALGPRRSYGLSSGDSHCPRITSLEAIADFRSLRPTFRVLLPAIFQFASSLPRASASLGGSLPGLFSASLFTRRAVFHSGSCSLIHLLGREQNSRLSPNGPSRDS